MGIYTGGYSNGTVNQVTHKVPVTLLAGWFFSDITVTSVRGQFGWYRVSAGAGSVTVGPVLTADSSIGRIFTPAQSGQISYEVGGTLTGYNTDTAFDADASYRYNVGATINGTSYEGTVVQMKTYAVTPTASTPVASSVASTTATISCDHYANTDESTATVWLEYRQLGTENWIQAGASASESGYGSQSLSRNLTGLTVDTAYQFRLNMTRTVYSLGTTFQSDIAVFTTTAASPDITTSAATNIGPTVATLNGIVDPNGVSTTYYIRWGTSSGSYPNSTTVQGPSTSSSPINFSADITGLSPSTTYYFKARAVYNSVNYDGSELTLTTSGSATAARIMPSLYEYKGKYGVSSTFTFFVEVPSATNSDRFLNSAVPWVAGDVVVTKDGGSSANIGTLPTRIGSTPEYTLTLTAAEMQGNEIKVRLIDADGPAWRDTVILVRTVENLGQLNVDATQIGSNNAAINATGVGTSAGIAATGGSTSSGDISGTLANHVLRRSTATAGGASSITLDASASATNDYYNNMVITIVSGTGASQSRVISDYDGGTKVATVNRSWSTNPASGSVFLILPADDVWNISAAAELSAVPTATSTYADKLSALWQRLFYKRTQTSTTQTLFKADSSTSLGTATVSDDGTTQTSGKIT